MPITIQTEDHWPDREHGPWLLRVSFGVADGALVPVGVELWAEPPPAPDSPHARWQPRPEWSGPPLTSAGLRVPLSRLTGEMTTSVAQLLPHIRQRDPEAAAALAGIVAPRRGRPKAHDDIHWGTVAGIYRAARDENYPGAAAIAQVYSVSMSTAWKWVGRCRALGMLAPRGQ